LSGGEGPALIFYLVAAVGEDFAAVPEVALIAVEQVHTAGNEDLVCGL